MQKWEYFTIAISYTYAQKNRPPIVRVVNGIALKDKPFLSTYLNQLGEEGWELISNESGVIIFKRPKP